MGEIKIAGVINPPKINDFEAMVKILNMHFPDEAARPWFEFQQSVKIKLQQRIEFWMKHQDYLSELVDDVFEVTDEWIHLMSGKPGYQLHHRDEELGVYFFTVKEENSLEIYILNGRNQVLKFYSKHLEYFNPFFPIIVDANKTVMKEFVYPTKYLITLGVDGFEKAFLASGLLNVWNVCFTQDPTDSHRFMLRVVPFNYVARNPESIERVYFQLFRVYQALEKDK